MEIRNRGVDTEMRAFSKEPDLTFSQIIFIASDKRPHKGGTEEDFGSMERTGIEPVTPCLQSRCSPS